MLRINIWKKLKVFLAVKICITIGGENSIGYCQEKNKKNRNHRTRFCDIMVSSRSGRKETEASRPHTITTQKGLLMS